MLPRRFFLAGALGGLLGCSLPGRSFRGQNAQVPVTNPLLVMSRNEELVWERAIDVLHDFQFEIGRENRLGRVIETLPKVGAGLFEPWHSDSVGFESRLESSLQSIRRIVLISLQPDDNGQGFLVSVTVQKELEDLPGVAGNSAGAATFSESVPLARDLAPVVGQSSASYWIPQGRDLLLEEAILRRLHTVYSW
ncbi:hypothetical protein SH668x_003599 [Planctomicrobium sp. SH668]|uniref:hypothetical protein n=1 Tax=Planctomicrobium sp. SH668 TaxID=3448126 RepID=UPI003F5BEF3A